MTDAAASFRSSAAAASLRRLLSRADNPLVRAVARLPAKLRTKLSVAFLAIAGLLVLVSLLGVRVLGQSNSRSEGLKTQPIAHLSELVVRLAPAPRRHPAAAGMAVAR